VVFNLLEAEMAKNKEEARLKRKLSIRKRIHGTMERPRLIVFRSTKHIYAQVVDDVERKTLVAISTLSKAVGELTGLQKKERARRVGQTIAQQCLAKGIQQVVFDRNGFGYHGRISALADAARGGGLKF
jgi:large subunit ribosomal protein L18